MSSRGPNDLKSQPPGQPLDDLSKSERRFRDLVDRLHEIVFEYDEEARFTFLNAAWTKFLGYEVEEGIGKSFSDFVEPQDRGAALRLLSMGNTGSNSSSQTAEIRLKNKQNEVVWFELSLALGAGSARQGSLRDLTEKKRAETFSRLKRFFSPQVAELILNGDAKDPLRSRRRDIAVVFLDLRGFTSFAETSEPEEVMALLHEFHADMGRIIESHEGTLERFTGDGMMIFFNDPIEVPNPTERAIRMALDMQERIVNLSRAWRKQGWDLTAGIGIAQGFATIGAIGYEGRWDYGAIGTVTNLAARLCGHAREFEILISERGANLVRGIADVEQVGVFDLKGFSNPMPVFRVQEPSEE